MGNTVDRRSFLKLGAASAGAAMGCRGSEIEERADDAPMRMRYRQLGSTGIEVSEVSFGAHGIDNATLMAASLEAGINTFCTSGGYLDGREEEALGDAIARTGIPRDKIVILTGDDIKPHATVNSILADFDASLRRLRTDYIDLYYNAMVQTPNDVRSEVLFEAFEKARTVGKVRHLAMSGHHGGMQDCLEAGIETGHYEMFFTKYDFVSYPDQDDILRRAADRGIGTMVFKTNAGNRQKEIKDLEEGGLSYRQATIRWALTNSYVASVTVSLTSFDQINEAVAAVGSRLNKAEVAMLRHYAGEMYDQYCRFCATCQGSCSKQVAVADVMRYAMYFQYYGREKEAMRLYGELPAAATAQGCHDCAGECDSACPFGRKVRAGLIEAHERLSWNRA
jgi:aryl-alcohol dehydrogenase-like predicted oxidoreductase